MEQKREIQVVMLPTNKSSQILMHKEDKHLFFSVVPLKKGLIMGNPQHLYFTSDEEIKEGDWHIFMNKIYQATEELINQLGILDVTKYKKIISSTDESLGLPSPSQAFIQKYCEQGGINKVLVEYVNTCDVKRGDCCCSEQDIDCQNHSLKLKIDSHNTISTFPIKDNSEHIYHINQLVNHLCSKIDKKTIDIVRKESTNWINENL